MPHSSSHLSPLERYQRDIDENGFEYDKAQEGAIHHLQGLYEELSSPKKVPNSHKALHLVKNIFKKNTHTPIQGLYFWGGVGRGKTYLMDTFFEALPFEEKKRTHFHRFMRSVHKALKKLPDQSDPLESVAEKMAGQFKVLCFDEFFVADITDAMILAGLLDALFRRGVVLVATSNIEPEGLYKDGLQRARFLPAIDLLNRHTTIVNVDGGIDYRLRTLEQASLYHAPANTHAHAALEKFFWDLVPDHDAICEGIEIEVEGRSIPAIKEAEDVVWFDFMAVCDGPRSQVDYIELAREYHAVFVENVPMLGASNDDQARRFIYLVDEFYDRNVKLIISAEKPIHELYRKGRLSFEFDRTISRIQEMQSKDYLACAHKP
ncbi:MAG: AFG1 family ATPase [Agarilytica sp.]